MKKTLRGILVVAVGLPIGTAAYAQANRPPAPVTVTNPIGQPVPVLPLGTTPVSGDVRITGTADVNVVNTPLVEIGNAASDPVPVEVQGLPEVGLAPANRTFSYSSNVAAGESQEVMLPEPMLVSILEVQSPDDFVQVVLIGPEASGKCFGDRCTPRLAQRVVLEVNVGREVKFVHFPLPIPTEGFFVTCRNLSLPCNSNTLTGVGQAW